MTLSPFSRDVETAVAYELKSEELKKTATSPSSPPDELPDHGSGHGSLPNTAHDDVEVSGGIKLFTIMTGITLACFLMLLDTAILVTAIPRITTDFHSITDIGWYGAAYQLGSAGLNPLTGKLYANFNIQWTFLTFFVIFELGSLLCGAAQSSDMLIVGRAIAGLGTSGIQSGTFTIIASCMPLHRQPALIGICMGVAQFGLVIGPLVGGALTQYTTWRWCFYINLPCGAVVGCLLLFVRMPDPISKPRAMLVLRNLHHHVDLLGAVLFAPACVMLLLAVQWGGNTYAWDSSVIIGLFIGAGATFLVWLAWNWYRGDAAMIPLSMVTRGNVWCGCLTFGLLMSTLFCTSYYLPIYFQSVRGATPTLGGVYMLPSVVAQLLGAICSGKLVERVGYYLPFSVFSGVCMAVGYGLVSTFAVDTSTGRWIGYQILVGFGCGIGLQIPLVAVQHTTAPTLIPLAIALTVFFQTFFGALFLSFADTIFTNTLRDRLRDTLSPSTVAQIIASGGTGFRDMLTTSQLSTVVSAYAVGVDRVFYMLAGLGVACSLCAFGLGWNDVRQKPREESKD